MIDTVKLYFFSDKRYATQQNCPPGCSDNYRKPSSYTAQYHDGSQWVDVADQGRTPSAPAPNYNSVEFTPITTQRPRVVMTPMSRADSSSYGIGLKEVQVFDTAPTSVARIRQLNPDRLPRARTLDVT